MVRSNALILAAQLLACDGGHPASRAEERMPTAEEWEAWGCRWIGPDGREIDYDPRPHHVDGGFQCRRPIPAIEQVDASVVNPDSLGDADVSDSTSSIVDDSMIADLVVSTVSELGCEVVVGGTRVTFAADLDGDCVIEFDGSTARWRE